jgi:hypothetical protein
MRPLWFLVWNRGCGGRGGRKNRWLKGLNNDSHPLFRSGGGGKDPLYWRRMDSFEIIGAITDIETIAVGPAIREVPRLRQQYGPGRWRKLKGVALIRLPNGRVRKAELHWYEAHGVGRKEFKRKHYLD